MITAEATKEPKKCADCGSTEEPIRQCNWDGKYRCIICATKYGKENKGVK